MIFGVGTDMVRVARMQKNLDTYQEHFAERILTPAEMEDFRADKKPAHFLAKRFAAKEAAAKAMGLGFQNGLQLRHIGVRNDALGKPVFEFTGFARKFLDDRGISGTHLSLSDEDEFAVAFVVLET